MSEPVLHVERRERGTAVVSLNRPTVRNAFNAELIAALRAAFVALSADATVRAIVLAGTGTTFCGGADINWMRASVALGAHENLEDAERLAEMFAIVDACRKPVIGRVQGAALGGGAGLAAVCDVVVAASDATFGFTETKLGLIPAVISPFVVAKIGRSAARALFTSGKRFDAAHALRIGLVHEVVAAGDLDSCVEAWVREFATAGPDAVAAAKRLVADVATLPVADLRAHTTHAIALARTSPEGQEGLHAFLERRPPHWAKA